MNDKEVERVIADGEYWKAMCPDSMYLIGFTYRDEALFGYKNGGGSLSVRKEHIEFFNPAPLKKSSLQLHEIAPWPDYESLDFWPKSEFDWCHPVCYWPNCGKTDDLEIMDFTVTGIGDFRNYCPKHKEHIGHIYEADLTK